MKEYKQGKVSKHIVVQTLETAIREREARILKAEAINDTEYVKALKKPLSGLRQAIKLVEGMENCENRT